MVLRNFFSRSARRAVRAELLQAPTLHYPFASPAHSSIPLFFPSFPFLQRPSITTLAKSISTSILPGRSAGCGRKNVAGKREKSFVAESDDFEEMSSMSRRACFKCGSVGHFADACPETERLCYNCKEPGHESNSCPHPRTTERKQCYHCQGFGHVQADCPTLRISGAPSSSRCYSCGDVGHWARNCPNPNGTMGRGGGMGNRGGNPRGANGGGRPSTCYKCGGPNHYARDCQAQAMKCYACGKLGHISKDCNAPNGGPLSTAGRNCYQCGETGHISRDCPQNNHVNAGRTNGTTTNEDTNVAASL